MLENITKMIFIFALIGTNALAMNSVTTEPSGMYHATRESNDSGVINGSVLHNSTDDVDKLKNLDDYSLGNLFLKKPSISKFCSANLEFLVTGEMLISIKKPSGNVYIPSLADSTIKFPMHVEQYNMPSPSKLGQIPDMLFIDERVRVIGRYLKSSSMNLAECTPFSARTVSIANKNFYQDLKFVGNGTRTDRVCFFTNPLESTNKECSIRSLPLGPSICNLAYKVARTENKAVTFEVSEAGVIEDEGFKMERKTLENLMGLRIKKISMQVPPADFYLPWSVMLFLSDLMPSTGDGGTFFGKASDYLPQINAVKGTILLSLLMTHKTISRDTNKYPQFSPALKNILDLSLKPGSCMGEYSMFDCLVRPFKNRNDILTNPPTEKPLPSSLPEKDDIVKAIDSSWQKLVDENKFVSELGDKRRSTTQPLSDFEGSNPQELPNIKRKLLLEDTSVLRGIFSFWETWTKIKAMRKNVSASAETYMLNMDYILQSLKADMDASFLNDRQMTWELYAIPTIDQIKSYSLLLKQKVDSVAPLYADKCLLDNTPIENPDYPGL